MTSERLAALLEGYLLPSQRGAIDFERYAARLRSAGVRLADEPAPPGLREALDAFSREVLVDAPWDLPDIGTGTTTYWECYFCHGLKPKHEPQCLWVAIEAALEAATPASPAPEAEGLRRDPRVDWEAVERLVDAEIRRGEITVSRGAEILGLRLRTWRDRALELAATEQYDTPPTPDAAAAEGEP